MTCKGLHVERGICYTTTEISCMIHTFMDGALSSIYSFNFPLNKTKVFYENGAINSFCLP